MSFRPLPARSPVALLKEEKPLRALFDQAQRIDHLQRVLEGQLQPAAREHCRVASWRDGCLLLIISDGHWTTRMRYQQRRLQRQLQALEEFANLTKIIFKVQPSRSAGRNPSQGAALSAYAAESLQSTAEGISDPRLRAALERLASRARPTD